MQKVDELAPLLELLRLHPPRTVVEIGTARGGSLYAWCRVARPDALVVSIDLPGGAFGGGYGEEELPRLSSYARRRQELAFLMADSHQEATRADLVRLLDGRRIDFLMIDGDHSYEGVRLDFEMYAPLVGDGGLVAFHDVLPHPERPDCEVDRFWHEVRGAYPSREFLQPDHSIGFGQWGGIGVLELAGGVHTS
jgi:cephalosporin hydroxylase